MSDCVKKLASVSATFRLRANCRNTKRILETNKVTTCFPDTGTSRVEEPQTYWIKYKDQAEEQLIKLLEDLRNQRIIGSDLVILSKYAIGNPKNLLHNMEILTSLGKLKKKIIEYRKEEEMARSFLPLLSMLKFVMVSPTEKAVSFRDNFDGASRSRDLVQKNSWTHCSPAW